LERISPSVETTETEKVWAVLSTPNTYCFMGGYIFLVARARGTTEVCELLLVNVDSLGTHCNIITLTDNRSSPMR
jgi:hypothetical protein